MRPPDRRLSPEPEPEQRVTRARARDDHGASEPALKTSDPTRPAASVPSPGDGHEDAAPDGHEDAIATLRKSGGTSIQRGGGRAAVGATSEFSD